MRLYIAEKPSLGRAIADAIPGIHKPIGKTHIALAGGDIVAWSAGHILEQAMPEAYGEQYKKWDIGVLPIIPSVWEMKVKKSTGDLFYNILKLLKSASEVVHAGDPDREGQLLIDEILEYCHYKGPVMRLLINDYNPDAVRKTLANLRPNEEFLGLSNAAVARSRADWIHGINMTRLYTRLAQKRGFKEVLRIGRVKTPVTALVVRRDREIESFVPQPYIHVAADFAFQTGKLRATWKPEDSQAGLDEEGRLISRETAEALAAKIEGKPCQVVRCETKPKKTPPPIGYTLPALQIDCSKYFNMPAQQTLKIAQSLYESGFTTYPRSDCGYLPTAHKEQAEAVIGHIAQQCPGLWDLIKQEDLNLSRKAAVWNDKKVAEHHAIIPTEKPKQQRSLTAGEKSVFDLIARRYLSFFLPDHAAKATVVEVNVEAEKFVANGSQLVNPGWKVLLMNGRDEKEEGDLGEEEKKTASQRSCDDGNADKTDKNAPEDEAVKIPKLSKGDQGLCEKAIFTDKKTKPPVHFTEATLIQAMNNVHRFVQDAKIKKILKETDGIGTAATQARILGELFESGQLRKDGKKVLSTDVAKRLIDVLPVEITLPDLTALWEIQFRTLLKGKGDGKESLASVLDGITAKVRELVAHAKKTGAISMPLSAAGDSNGAKANGAATGNSHPCLECGRPLLHIVKKADEKDPRSWDFFACNSCGTKFNNSEDKPVRRKPAPQPTGKICAKCGKAMLRRSGKSKEGKAYDFLGCSGFPDCKQTEEVKSETRESPLARE